MAQEEKATVAESIRALRDQLLKHVLPRCVRMCREFVKKRPDLMRESPLDPTRRVARASDEADDANAIVEVRAGTGGDEAALFTMEMFQMYERYISSATSPVYT